MLQGLRVTGDKLAGHFADDLAVLDYRATKTNTSIRQLPSLCRAALMIDAWKWR